MTKEKFIRVPLVELPLNAEVAKSIMNENKVEKSALNPACGLCAYFKPYLGEEFDYAVHRLSFGVCKKLNNREVIALADCKHFKEREEQK